LTYGEVAKHLELPHANVLAQPLRLIMTYCETSGLPPLTCLVVKKETGRPGSGHPTTEDFPHDREAVFKKNWFALPPVQIKDFEAL
jgi:hypothetical protein